MTPQEQHTLDTFLKNRPNFVYQTRFIESLQFAVRSLLEENGKLRSQRRKLTGEIKALKEANPTENIEAA